MEMEGGELRFEYHRFKIKGQENGADRNMKNKKSTPCDLKVIEVSEKETSRIKFVLTHFKTSF